MADSGFFKADDGCPTRKMDIPQEIGGKET